MEAVAHFVDLGIALAAGLLIGFERQQSASEHDPKAFLGGARTHPLVALLGGCAMLLSREVGPWLLVLGLVATSAMLAISYFDDVRRGLDRGLTSEFALLLSFVLGALAASRVVPQVEQRALLVVAVAVVATVLLSMKLSLHSLVRRASREDLYATLKFLVAAVVVLPLLPDRTYGPLDVLNPRQLGLMAVLIAGIGFCGYFGIRVLGTRRGLGLTGLVGGLVSSTAVTLSFSGRAREQPGLSGSCALAVVLASSIMFGRVLLEVAVVNPALLSSLVWPMAAMLAAGLLCSLWLYRSSRRVEATLPDVPFSNPFELTSALKFALLFGLVLLASKAATTYLGAGGTYVTGLLAGTTDVDAITLSMARLAKNGLAPEVAVTTILLGAASNTLVKASMAAAVGGWAFGRRIATIFALTLTAGALGLVVVWR